MHARYNPSSFREYALNDKVISKIYEAYDDFKKSGANGILIPNGTGLKGLHKKG